MSENVYKVKLVTQRTSNEPKSERTSVVFDATPDLSESRTVNYSTVEPVHMPGQIFVYKNVSSRTFSLSNIRLISRNALEADNNISILWTLRGWTMPRFGNSSTLTKHQETRRAMIRSGNVNLLNKIQKQDDADRRKSLGQEQLGAPPEVLLLSAYSSGADPAQGGQAFTNQHINKVPVVIQTLNIPYPSDIDYILSSDGTPMPTIMTIDMTLVETHSAREYQNFSLRDFREGNLSGF